uniref:AP-5 complex subunit beta-1 n=1 Tax=Gasterosteus aculeatus TaxID=69293 RepID=G3PAL8_GASAC
IMAANWAERISAFSRSPSRFLSGTTAEDFLAELLRELRDDRASFGAKVLLLSPLCEHPSLLCPSAAVGEETAMELMSVLAQCPPKSVQFRCQLLVALTAVLVCASCVATRSRASQDFLDLLLQLVQDTGDLRGDDGLRSPRAAACDCLRELEACSPGLLAQRLELLGGLRQRETSRLHQAYAGLHALVLRNAVYRLARDTGAGGEQLKALLGGNAWVAWEAELDSGPVDDGDCSAALSSLALGPMGTVPTLQTGPDCKELRSVLSSLLEESYLLTPLCQAALLHRLTEVVAMVPGVPPAVFRAQLLRLLGTSEVCLLHATLLLKCAFTDSLFSAEDEAFLLQRLVVLAQHPLLSAPEKLFHVDCLLHFPENRPIGCGADGDEAPPVLLTPRLASALAPTVFDDGATGLARLNLLSLVYLEEAEGGEGEESRGLAYLYEHVGTLLRVVASGGGRELVVTAFRAVFLFLFYFCHVERYCRSLTEELCQLYLRHAHLAPHAINLADRVQEKLAESDWAVGFLRALQGVITMAPPTSLTWRGLGYHLKALARVAEEGAITQHRTVRFLSGVIAAPPRSPCAGGAWRLGNGLLAVCRRLLVHPGLDSLFIPLADVLQHLSRCYGDTDIQDHARLYYTLLTTLSREKLAGVLAADGGRRVKKRSLSCIVGESEGLASALTVHRTEKSLIGLTEVRSAPPAAEAGELFSIRLHFGLTDAHYEELADVSVPRLLRGRAAAEVTLRLKPRRPRPTTLHASAIFTAEDGLSWFTVLPQVHVAFQQAVLFEALWGEMSAEDQEDCATSLFCCQAKEGPLSALVAEHFLPFLVSDRSDEDEFKVLIFLPPRAHVLLRIRPGEPAQFHIATDDWRLLSHLNSYLLTITSS